MPSTERAPVPIVLELADSLAGNGAAFPVDACRSLVAARFDDLLKALGIPGCPEVTLTTGAAPDTHRPLRLTVNGRCLRYPDDLITWTASYVAGVAPAFSQSFDELLRSATGDRADVSGAADFVAVASVEIAKIEPAVLLDAPQAKAYADELAGGRRPTAGPWPPPAPWLSMILKGVLAQRVSIGDVDSVAGILADSRSIDATVVEIVEALINALACRDVEVLLSERSGSLFDEDVATLRERFTFMRDGLFAETGLSHPPFRIRLGDDLKPGAFTFRVGCLTTPPMLHLALDECLVNDSPERLTLSQLPDGSTWPARSTVNPATGQPASIAPLSSRAVLDGQRLTTWDRRDHVILCLAEALRRHGSSLITTELVRDRCRVVEGESPQLARAVHSRYTEEQVADLLRRLVAEGVSIRDVHLIFDQLAAHADMGRDERRLVSSVRARLRLAIRDKLARGSNTVVVYLLDPKVEERLALQRWNRQTEATLCEAILAGVRQEFRWLRDNAPTASVPAILTSSEARAAVRALISPEFPRVAVIAYEDLPGDTNIQPVARIAFDPPA